MVFEVFRAYLREFLTFFHEIFMVARSCGRNKKLLVSALVSLEKRLKVPILAIFDDFWHFFKLSVLVQAFDLGQSF